MTILCGMHSGVCYLKCDAEQASAVTTGDLIEMQNLRFTDRQSAFLHLSDPQVTHIET